MKKKTIFTTITLGLVTLLGFGFLGGIHYQPKEVKAIEITTQPTKKQVKVTFTTDMFGTDKLYYFQAKAYDNNGYDYFCTGNTLPSGGKRYYDGNFDIDIEMDFITQYQIEVTTLQMANTTIDGQHYLDKVRFWRGGGYGYAYLFRIGTSADYFIFNRDYCAFTAKNLRMVHSSQDKEFGVNLLNSLFDVYTLTDTSFDFIDNFNYNAWAGPDGAVRVPGNLTSVRNYEAIIGNQGTGFPGSNVVTYNVPKFFAGNLVFDKIQVYYISGTGLSFEWNNEVIISRLNPPNTANEYVYYSHMFFINSATQYTIEVNRRDSVYTTGTHGTIIRQSTTWLDNSFKNIQFFEILTDNDIRFFDATRNNLDVGTGFYDNVGADIGLGNAFSLIGQAFTAWLPILQVTIVPGITLGLLLFLPLIAGIVIFIIWIVKR